MVMCWRFKNMPELKAVPLSSRDRMWSEAVTRSFTSRYLLLFANLALGVFLRGCREPALGR